MRTNIFVFTFFLLFTNIFTKYDLPYLCKPEDRDSTCKVTLENPYKTVCGWFNKDINCRTYPCAATYASPCLACKKAEVEKVTEGKCPPK